MNVHGDKHPDYVSLLCLSLPATLVLPAGQVAVQLAVCCGSSDTLSFIIRRRIKDVIYV